MFAEAFRSLRSSLIFMPNQSELKTLIITSAIPNEGKSTVASNLAITMSAAGARCCWWTPTFAGATSPRYSTPMVAGGFRASCAIGIRLLKCLSMAS